MGPERGGAVRSLLTIVSTLMILGALAFGALKVAGSNDPAEPPGLAASPSPSPTESASPSPTRTPSTYVIKTEGACLRIRETPGLSGELVNCLASGLTVRGDGRIRRADGLRWAYVTWVDNPKTKGWAATKFLDKVEDEEEPEE